MKDAQLDKMFACASFSFSPKYGFYCIGYCLPDQIQLPAAAHVYKYNNVHGKFDSGGVAPF